MTSPTIDKKWVIFDTCTLSKLSILGDATPVIIPILKQIGSFTPVITPLVRFEYLRQAKFKDELESFKKYLALEYVELGLSSKDDRFDIYQLSSEVACVCRLINHEHHKHIQLTDYIHGGLLRRYPKNLFLLTFDINDFPEPIFEIVHHKSIKIGKQLEIWALFKFNKERFSEKYEHFKKKPKK